MRGFKQGCGGILHYKIGVISVLNILSCHSAPLVGGGVTTHVSAVKNGKMVNAQ